ncbi:MAG TPA: DUF222 domain-containing protein [Candidatus Lustribacter sp.]|nr:DUF222 domain-containing protein [Candidatus Lustribacter sp.]
MGAFLARLERMDRDVTDSERLDQIGALERVKGAAAAAQARVTADFDVSRRAAEQAAGVPASRRGRGVGSEVALARRESPARGSRHLGLATALVREMPCTMAALSTGLITEWAATLICQETAILTRADRQAVDAELGPELSTMSDLQIAKAARAAGYRLDPASAVRRVRGAVADRRVTCRPAPDCMARVSALLPVAQGVAVFAALDAAAKSARAAGDERSRGQVMADTLVTRVTGQARAQDVPIMVNLVMTQPALLGQDDTPAHLQGFGPVPADLARDLVTGAQSRSGLRRLFASTDRRRLVAMESPRRTFPRSLADFIALRDQACRTPYCDAPIRHTDHVVPAARGGPTSERNGQGLCERCNYVKALPGWSARADETSGGRHEVVLTTPTGHTHTSTAPPPLGHGAIPRDVSPVERRIRLLLAA